jgi:hypothetical protein
MAQTGYTPLLVYATATASTVPTAANLTSTPTGAELAINYTDGKLYYKDNTGTVQLLASKAAASISFPLSIANGGTGNTFGAATAVTNSGGWSVTPSGTKLYFNYNGTNVASLDSSGNFIAKANVTAAGTP